MKTLLSIFFACMICSASAQNNENLTIRVKATSSAPANEFLIDIYKTATAVKVVYSLRDSVSYKMNLDKNYFALNDLLMTSFAKASKDSLIKLQAKLDSIRSSYAHYSKDSITVPIADLPGYLALLNEVNTTGNVELTNSSSNAARNKASGPLFEFWIISPKERRRVYAQYPTASTNPVLYQLITESLKIYRDRMQNRFLSKMRTNSY